MSDGYRWLNEHRLTHQLDKITDDDELDDVLDALDEIARDPNGSPLAAPMQGTRDHVDRMIALLPHGWVVVYSIYEQGVPPGPQVPSLVVRSFDKRF